MRGDYRSHPPGSLFKLFYWAGKITPFFACGSFAVAFYVQGDMVAAAGFAGLAVVILAVALYVVGLRKQGLFYGVADLLKSTRRN